MSLVGNGWDNILQSEFEKKYFKDLLTFLEQERSTKEIYPPQADVFNAFKFTPPEKVKAVILGQDPYHGEGQAHGLCFSVKRGIKTPPSLKNIYKEMKSDLGLDPIEHGFLEPWAHQGVLMLNAVLTVEKGKPASHRKKGWEEFTDFVVQYLNAENENLVFILWGNDAKKKGEHIDRKKHLVLESAHPSPFSVKKFLGCKHFSKTNEYLESKNIKSIEWKLDS